MIAVTTGDPSGIGPEIVHKALSSLLLRGTKRQNNLLLIGNRTLMEDLKDKLKIKPDLLCPIIDAFDDFKYQFGKVQKQCGIASALQLHLASHLLKIGKIKGIVTAPVSKTALGMAGFPYAGQTEYFAREFGAEKYAMLGWSEQVKIVLVTIHTPLKQVPKLITEQNVLEKIKLLNDYLIRFEKKRKPKIGVFSLNPHAFEFTCGAEEKILTAIKQARKIGIQADGPLPADSAFSSAFRSSLLPRFDAYVSMYHDQGMLPVKLISQGAGVNMTLGLPFIRTSPLHGVAFDIAGKGIADPSSMISAIQLCLKLTQTK